VCREARAAITVALTGDGGDELFGGYGKYSLLARRSGLERALTPSLTRGLAAAGSLLAPGRLAGRLKRYRIAPGELVASTLVTGTAPAALRAAARGPLAEALAGYDPLDVVRSHLLRAPPDEVGIANAMRYLDLKLTLGAGILTKLDRAAMAVSLETRPVFLNRRLLDLVGRIPPTLLASARTPKQVLRAAVRGWLPASILDRPKQGFAMPLGDWLLDDLRGLTDGLHGGALDELIDPGFTARVVGEHAAGRARTAELHNLMFLRHWLDAWTTSSRPLEPLLS
jgi:asparagine synthase (glutamine-hydrolysing)